MSAPDLDSILQLLRSPSTTKQAALRLGCSVPVLDGLMRQLEARGLVVTATPGVGACSSGCGLCSMKNFCPSSEEPKTNSLGKPESDDTWRLTERGAQLLKPRSHR